MRDGSCAIVGARATGIPWPVGICHRNPSGQTTEAEGTHHDSHLRLGYRRAHFSRSSDMIPAHTFMPEFLLPVVIAVARDRVRSNRFAVYPRAYHGTSVEQAGSRGVVDPPSLQRDRYAQLATDVMGVATSAAEKPLNARRLRVAT